jgi:hypothetical protein
METEEVSEVIVNAPDERKYYIGKKQYTIPGKDSPLRRMFNEVLKNYELPLSYDFDINHLREARFEICMVSPYASKTCIARIMKSSPEMKMLSSKDTGERGIDYLIEFSHDYFTKLTDDVQRVVIVHELQHAYVTYDKEENPVYKLVKHDVEDFYNILEKYGLEWKNAIRTVVAESAVKPPKNKDDATPEEIEKNRLEYEKDKEQYKQKVKV